MKMFAGTKEKSRKSGLKKKSNNFLKHRLQMSALSTNLNSKRFSKEKESYNKTD
jgi:hypothetical protein